MKEQELVAIAENYGYKVNRDVPGKLYFQEPYQSLTFADYVSAKETGYQMSVGLSSLIRMYHYCLLWYTSH